MQHSEIWRAIDALASRRGLSASGLARAAGLDPTTFNKSKRQTPDGRARWPSTESITRALLAVDSSWDEFAVLVAGAESGPAIPIVSMARARNHDLFDETGFPIAAKETIRFPNLGDGRVYALEVAGDAMEPAFRNGDIVIVQPGAAVRRGDRVVVRTRAGDLIAKVLGRRNDQTIELGSANPAEAPQVIAAADVDWIARILWASQ